MIQEKLTNGLHKESFATDLILCTDMPKVSWRSASGVLKSLIARIFSCELPDSEDI